jgi:hypothetical protein
LTIWVAGRTFEKGLWPAQIGVDDPRHSTLRGRPRRSQQAGSG